MKERKYKVGVLDIGTSKIRALIANVGISGKIEIVGYGENDSEGVLKGYVYNNKTAMLVIRQTIEEAEKMAKCQINDLVLNINGDHIKSNTSFSSVNISDVGSVEQKHLNQVIKNATKEYSRPDLAVIHAIPRNFRVDESKVGLDVLGVKGQILRAEVHVVVCSKDYYAKYAQVINEAGFSLGKIYSSTVANELSVLDSKTKNDGVLLVDFGGGTTSYAIYKNGSIQYSKVLAIGGDHFNNDLVLGLELSADDAEALKKEYTKIDPSADSNNIIKLRTPQKTNKKIDKQNINLILSARAEELVNFINKDIVTTGMPENVVFVGGGSNFELVIEKAREKFGRNIVRGIPKIYDDLTVIQEGDIYYEDADEIKKPEWTTAVGILKHAALRIVKNHDKKPGIIKRIFSIK